jgi:hypothetical protein
VAVGAELQRLKLHIPELKTVVYKIQHSGFIGCVEHRPAELNLDGAPELVGRQLIIKIYQQVALNPLRKTEDIVSPYHTVHELIDVTLHALKNLPVGTLYLLS